MSHEGIRFATKEEQAREDAENRPLPRIAMTPEKVRVLLTEGKGLEIDWKDGHKSAWGFAFLRAACPCATCVEERAQLGLKPGESKPKAAELLPMYTPPPKPSSVQPVGRYALQFNWLDGHTSGIYSWEYLRRTCQCHECTFASAAPTGVPN
ncbi:MAG: gamma-butyrobetaine hydroxylase-like domain-containing protein [Acidobacteriota bacterium]